MDIIVKTFQGLEEVLEKEILDLGGENTKIIRRGVRLQGDLALLYRLNYQLRTALRILVPLASFKAKNEDEFYQTVTNIAWDKIFSADESFAIDPVVRSEYFKHSQYISLKCKDAIVDYFRNKFNKRPNVDTKSPDIRFNLYINQDHCEILLDSSGDSLHKRGYRVANHQAPMNEVLAAGLVLLTQWDKKQPILDPFCGSGTLLIEAALLASNTPVQHRRNAFCFMNWKNFDQQLWSEVKAKANQATTRPKITLVGKDILSPNLRMAKENAKSAGVDGLISFSRADFTTSSAPFADGIILTNPPYGERIGEDIDVLYNKIGTTLKQEFQGFTAYIISSNLEAFKHVGLSTSRRFPLYNGPLECRLMRYDMYKGSKRTPKQ